MTRTAQRARILAAMFEGQRYFPTVPMPDDVNDAEKFPNIAAATQGLSPERLAQIEKDWNA